jgi:hypothetical protein
MTTDPHSAVDASGDASGDHRGRRLVPTPRQDYRFLPPPSNLVRFQES